MSHIIAGRLQQQTQVQHAISQLIDAGFSKQQISTFYVNPSGQHDLYPYGGDREASPGAKETGEGAIQGAATGGAIGAVVGIAGVPLTGPVSAVLGAMVGAHIGSLVGGLSKTKEKGEKEDGNENKAPLRQSGMVVAVSVNSQANENTAIHLLKQLGADQIERAEGTIADGNWKDFDPLKSPELIAPVLQ